MYNVETIILIQDRDRDQDPVGINSVYCILEWNMLPLIKFTMFKLMDTPLEIDANLVFY